MEQKIKWYEGKDTRKLVAYIEDEYKNNGFHVADVISSKGGWFVIYQKTTSERLTIKSGITQCSPLK